MASGPVKKQLLLWDDKINPPQYVTVISIGIDFRFATYILINCDLNMRLSIFRNINTPTTSTTTTLELDMLHIKYVNETINW